jgi:hypothetical protein
MQYDSGGSGIPIFVIWHSFFGIASSHNDINMLNFSMVFNRLMEGTAPKVSYGINGKPYYLVDVIYPDTQVKIIRNTQTEKDKRFPNVQEACRKDMKRTFGLLQAWWAIFRYPTRTTLQTRYDVMTRSVIMRNMHDHRYRAS